jgi:hypothetical protein
LVHAVVIWHALKGNNSLVNVMFEFGKMYSYNFTHGQCTKEL